MLSKAAPQYILLCALLCWSPPVRADDLKTADEIIAKHIEAMGGRKKLDAVKTAKMSGKSIFQGGMEAPLTLEFKDPNKVRIEFTFQGMTGVQAFDGETGWFVMPFMGKTDPEKMSPDQVKEVEERADFAGPLVDYRKKGHEVELVGKDEVEGSEVYKLKLTKKSGDVEYHFLDAEYFLTIQLKGKRKFQGTEIEFEALFGDYKEVDGLMLAHSIEQRTVGGMGGSTMIFEKIEFNIDIPDDRFTMPKVKPEAKPEVEKEKATEKDTEKPAEKEEKKKDTEGKG
jgi:outer membrane lipoprotein-sorting protein